MRKFSTNAQETIPPPGSSLIVYHRDQRTGGIRRKPRLTAIKQSTAPGDPYRNSTMRHSFGSASQVASQARVLGDGR